MHKKKILLAVILLFAVAITGCTNGGLLGDGAETDRDTGTLALFLADDFGDRVQEIHVFIDEIRVHSDDGGWRTIIDEFDGEDVLEVDLLELMFTSLKLGEVDLEPGQYNAIRLVLDEGSQDRHGEKDINDVSRVVYTDENDENEKITKRLIIPSAEQSGIKIDSSDFVIEDNQTEILMIDVDTSKFVDPQSGDHYMINSTAFSVIDMNHAADVIGQVLGQVEDDENDENGDNGDTDEASQQENDDSSSDELIGEAITEHDVYVEAYRIEPEDYNDDENGINFDDFVNENDPVKTVDAIKGATKEHDGEEFGAGSFIFRGLETGDYVLRAYVGVDEGNVDDTEYQPVTLEKVITVERLDGYTLEEPIILPLTESEENNDSSDNDTENDTDDE